MASKLRQICVALLLISVFVNKCDGGCGLDIPCWVRAAVEVATSPLKATITALTGTNVDLCSNFGNTFSTLGTDLGNPLSDILDYVEVIPEIVNTLEDVLSLPFSEIDGASDDIDSLANTLSTCVNEANNIIGSAVFEQVIAVTEILPIDVNSIAFKTVAVTLLPFKDQVEAVCVQGLQEILSMSSSWTNSSPNRRRVMSGKRRLYTDGQCEREGTLCQPREFQYPYEQGGNNYYEKMIDDFPAMFADKNDNTDPDTHQKFRSLLMGAELITSTVSEFCKLIINCYGWDPIPCLPKVVCAGLKSVFREFFVKILKYMVGSGGYHNARLQGARINAILMDGNSIIHNQFRLKETHTQLINDQTTNITSKLRDFNTSIDQQTTDAIKDITNNITYRIDQEFNASTTSINTHFATTLSTLQSGIIGIVNSNENGHLSHDFTLEKIKNAIDDLQIKFNEQYGAKSPGLNLPDTVKESTIGNSDNGMYIIKFRPYQLYTAVAVLILGTVITIAAINMLILRYYLEIAQKSNYAIVPKYEYSTSDDK